MFEPIETWFRERDVAKKLLVVLGIILWCLIVIFYFNSSDDMFYHD